MKKFKFGLAIPIIFLLTGCTSQTSKVADNFCENSEVNFGNHWFQKNQDCLDWYEECVNKNGTPKLDHDGAPNCSIKTEDGGKSCTDNSQCQGYCIAVDKNGESGACTFFEEYPEGCWFELINGGKSENCSG
jgi:hypothetical protein